MKHPPKQKKSGKDFYLKFYVNDFEADDKLMDCNPNAYGVYIKLLCLLFKCTPKGKIKIKSPCLDQFESILLKQNDKQSNKQIFKHLKNICLCVAPYFAKHLKFDIPEVESGLLQLLENDVIYLEDNFLCQKRMLRDYEISLVRALAGAEGGRNTQSRSKKNNIPPDVLIDDLLKQNLKQNKQQNPNYNYDYNYNSNSNEDKGVSNNTSGGMGVENSGGGEETVKISDYEGNWSFYIPVVFCKHFFFNHQAFSNLKDGAMKVLSNYWRVEEDVENSERVALMTERLALWADEFNDFLDRTEPKGTSSLTVKMMQGKDGWQNHFHNWLLSQKARLNSLPNKRIDNQQDNHINGNGTLISGSASIQAQEDFYKRKT